MEAERRADAREAEVQSLQGQVQQRRSLHVSSHVERTTEVRTHTEQRTTTTTAASPTVKYVVHQPVPVPTVPQPSVMLLQPQTFIQYAPHYVTAVGAPHRVAAPLTPGTYVVPGQAAQATTQVRTSDHVTVTHSAHDFDLQLEEIG